MDLTNYLPADLVDLAVRINAEPALLGGLDIDPSERLSLLSVSTMLEGGAKLLKPSSSICHALRHVELNIGPEDYAQPYTGLGVVLPGFLFGSAKDRLATTFWMPGGPVLITFFGEPGQKRAGVTVAVHLKLDPPPPSTIEEHLVENSDVMGGRPDVEKLLRGLIPVARVILNLCLFAVERGVRIVPPDPRAEKRRRKACRDGRMARLAARDAREVVIQDLDLILGPSAPTAGGDGSGGWRQRMHRRRGHWRMQAHGPGRSLRRRIFVRSYMVHFDDQGGEVQTILR